MEKIIEELRAQVAGLEAKMASLSEQSGKSAGEIKALSELKATFAADIEVLRGEIKSKEDTLKKPAAVSGEMFDGLGLNGILGSDNE